MCNSFGTCETTSQQDSELPFQTFERVCGVPWPGGMSPLVISLLNAYGINYPPGSAAANLTLQEMLVTGKAYL